MAVSNHCLIKEEGERRGEGRGGERGEEGRGERRGGGEGKQYSNMIVLLRASLLYIYMRGP